MKIYPSGYKEALINGSTEAFIISFDLMNGEKRFYTDFSEDIEIEGITYYSAARLQRSSISLVAGLDTSNFDLIILYNDNYIRKGDVKSGLFRGAYFKIESIIADNPSLGKMTFLSGRVGEAALKRVKVQYTLHSISDELNVKRARVTVASCPWDLGDMKKGRCMKDVSSYTIPVTVLSVLDNGNFGVSSTFIPTNQAIYFEGYIKFTSGLNNGLIESIRIPVFTEGFTRLWLNNIMPFNVAVGDTLNIYAGCDKTLSFCDTKFNNASNFGGQPYVPGEIKSNNGVQ